MPWLSALLVALAQTPTTPPAEPAPTPARGPLRVAVAGSAPFVLSAQGKPEGFSVDVWSELAGDLKLDYELVPMQSVPQALEAVRTGEADVAVGPISITSERLEQMEFTHRYFEATLGILAPVKASGPSEWVKPFLSKPFLFGIAALLTVLFIVGALMWLAERNHNAQQFPASPIHGIGNGVWMALVTMTTVGYGDRVPVTLAGRVLTGVWMLIAMITASSLTAGIATALTLQHLETGTVQTQDQLRGRAVAAVRGTTAERFVGTSAARLVPVTGTDQAVQRLWAGEAVAVVDDRPILQYWLREHPNAALALSDRTYEPQGYGFALQLESPLTHRLNLGLQALRERGELDMLRARWLGAE